jgi:protease II
MTPPTTRIDTVYDTYFGTTAADPYRWLEDWVWRSP